MQYLLFAVYLILFSWLVTRIRFFAQSGLTRVQLTGIFLLKVTAAVLYGWISLYLARKSGTIADTWAFHDYGIHAYRDLLKAPVEFLSSHFRNDYEEGYGNIIGGKSSWWQDLPNNVFVLMLALFNLLSFGSYYINALFYSFVTLFGPVAVYRVMTDAFPGRKAAVPVATFLFPSFLYWASGLHKEGLAFAGLALAIYNMYNGWKAGRYTVKRCGLIFLGISIVMVSRSFMVLLLLPSLLAWFLSGKLTYKPILVFGVVYLFSFVFFFSAKYLHPELDFPAAVAEKQKTFTSRRGSSAVPVDELKPTVAGFIKNAPEAFALSVLRPYPWEVKNTVMLAVCAENLLLLLLFLLFLFRRRSFGPASPFLLFCIFFSLTALFFIGYTVNFTGAIIRYRSIVIPFLVTPMAALIEWKNIGGLLGVNKSLSH